MKTILLILFGGLLCVALLPYALHRQPPMPEGTNLRSPAFAFSTAELLVDRTVYDDVAARHLLRHEIFDRALAQIGEAETFVLADFFLWNPWKGAIGTGSEMRPLAQQLANALIAKRIQNPDIPILVITDPINQVYGDDGPEYFDRMVEAGIAVVYTDLTKLPESNWLYAPVARFVERFAKEDPTVEPSRRFPNPFDPDGEKMTAAQLRRLLYFKANHRKVLVTGKKSGEMNLLVGSFNPADGSANHSNVAVLVDGLVAAYAAHSELAVANWSGEDAANIEGGKGALLQKTIEDIRGLLPPILESPLADGAPSASWIGEGAIREALVELFDSAGDGDQIDVAMFYFSDRPVARAVKNAAKRGAAVRIILDANKDAFGREKNGVPNRPLAAEFMGLAEDHTILVRWAATHGEQFHSKAVRVWRPGREVLVLGSANWTRRNIANLNLEANLLLENATELNARFRDNFDALWTNRDGFEETRPYEAYAEKGWRLWLKTALYRFQEWSGASTF